MVRIKTAIFIACLFFYGAPSLSQTTDTNLKTFGYFQISFTHQKDIQTRNEVNSFQVQQLNLFMQKNLTAKWTAFVNFEFLNSYSSFRDWGAHSIEEAWVSYRSSNQLKLKLGLQVPIFNNLNEIKNRTPLLPYVIRPLAYESSFNEIIAIEEFVPARAFVQVYGFIPWGDGKLEHAFFAGNSPNINSDPRRGQTGADSTNTFLFGGRLGVRYLNLKAGVSATFDKLDLSRDAGFLQYSIAGFRKVPRVRLGADFSFNATKFFGEAEAIRVTYDDDHPEFDFDREFYYATLGYHWTEKMFVYGSYWATRENYHPVTDQDIDVFNGGVSFALFDSLVLKAQYARVEIINTRQLPYKLNLDYYALALSVVF
jgi:hypothetical protein